VEGDHEGAGAVGDGEAVFGAEEGGVFLFEAGDLLAGAAVPFAAGEDAEEAFLFGGAGDGPTGEGFAADGVSAEGGGFGVRLGNDSNSGGCGGYGLTSGHALILTEGTGKPLMDLILSFVLQIGRIPA
jgi:hypothetical protein